MSITTRPSGGLAVEALDAGGAVSRSRRGGRGVGGRPGRWAGGGGRRRRGYGVRDPFEDLDVVAGCSRSSAAAGPPVPQPTTATRMGARIGRRTSTAAGEEGGLRAATPPRTLPSMPQLKFDPPQCPRWTCPPPSAPTATTSPPTCPAARSCSPPAAAASPRARSPRSTSAGSRTTATPTSTPTASGSPPRPATRASASSTGARSTGRACAARPSRPGPARPAAEEDGQATALDDVAALVFTADCLPVMLVADGAVAALHGGWRGLAGGIVAEGVAALRDLGADGPITAALGPGGARLLLRGRRGGPRPLRGLRRAGRRAQPRPRGRRPGAARGGRGRRRSTTSGCARSAPTRTCSSPTAATSGVTGRQAGVVWRA